LNFGKKMVIPNKDAFILLLAVDDIVYWRGRKEEKRKLCLRGFESTFNSIFDLDTFWIDVDGS
jgi:hypothetical protein